MSDPRHELHAPPPSGPAAGRRRVREVLSDAHVPPRRATVVIWLSLIAAVSVSIALVCVGFLGVDLPGIGAIGGSPTAGVLAIAIGQPVLWLLWLLVAREASKR